MIPEINFQKARFYHQILKKKKKVIKKKKKKKTTQRKGKTRRSELVLGL